MSAFCYSFFFSFFFYHSTLISRFHLPLTLAECQLAIHGKPWRDAKNHVLWRWLRKRRACAWLGLRIMGAQSSQYTLCLHPVWPLRPPGQPYTNTHADARKQLNSMEIVCAGSSLRGWNHCHEKVFTVGGCTSLSHTECTHTITEACRGGQLPNHSLNNLQLSTQTKKNLNAQGFFFVKFVSPQLACRPFHTILYITHKLMLTLLLWVYKSRREQKVSNFGSYFPHFTPNKVLINDND